MSYDKRYRFKLSPLMTARFCRSLMHPARIQIVLFLLKNGLTSYLKLCDLIPLSPPSVSRHIKKLMEDKIVIVQNMGSKTNYDVNLEVVNDYAFIFKMLSDELYDVQELRSKRE